VNKDEYIKQVFETFYRLDARPVEQTTVTQHQTKTESTQPNKKHPLASRLSDLPITDSQGNCWCILHNKFPTL